MLRNEIEITEGKERRVNHPPATLFEQFLKEREHLKNVTPRTLVWYRTAFKNYQAALADAAPSLPTKATMQQFVVAMRDRGVRPVTCNTNIAAMNAFCLWLQQLYTAAFRRLLRDSGVTPVVLRAWSPNLNAFAERFVGSAKSECWIGWCCSAKGIFGQPSTNLCVTIMRNGRTKVSGTNSSRRRRRRSRRPAR